MIDMYSIWDGTTWDGRRKSNYDQYITIPDEYCSNVKQCELSKFRKFLKKDNESIRRRNFWRMMRYWNKKSAVKTIDQKQFLLDTKLMIEDNWSGNERMYRIDREMLNYVRKFRDEIMEYYPRLWFIIENIEEDVLGYNIW